MGMGAEARPERAVVVWWSRGGRGAGGGGGWALRCRGEREVVVGEAVNVRCGGYARPGVECGRTQNEGSLVGRERKRARRFPTAVTGIPVLFVCSLVPATSRYGCSSPPPRSTAAPAACTGKVTCVAALRRAVAREVEPFASELLPPWFSGALTSFPACCFLSGGFLVHLRLVPVFDRHWPF